ncbi:MAG: NUDIX hydrolase [Minisyncoccota bacterium]
MQSKNIPDSAELVFEGVVFRVYQWHQELYDGSTAIFEKVVHPDSVEMIAMVDGRVIILEQEQPTHPKFISFPGGRVDPNEEPLIAAHRELLEETGHRSDDLFLWKTIESVGSVQGACHIFIARDCVQVHDGMPDPGEKIERRLIDFDELLYLVEHPRFRCKGYLKETLYRLRLYEEEKQAFYDLLFPRFAVEEAVHD